MSTKRPVNLLDAQKRQINTDSSQWTMRASKEGGSNITIVAYARAGTLESEPYWMIKKSTYDSAGDVIAINFAEGEADFIHIYDNSTAISITGATQANPCVISATGHGLSNGDIVELVSIGGMTELNNKFFIVASATANTFALTDLDGANINSTGYGAYTSGGSAYKRTFSNYDFS